MTEGTRWELKLNTYTASPTGPQFILSVRGMICFLKQREFPLDSSIFLENTVFLEPGPAWLAPWLPPQMPARPPPQVAAPRAPLSTSRAPSWEDPGPGGVLGDPSGQARTSSRESPAGTGAQGCQRATTLEQGDIPAPGRRVSPSGFLPGTLCLLTLELRPPSA